MVQALQTSAGVMAIILRTSRGVYIVSTTAGKELKAGGQIDTGPLMTEVEIQRRTCLAAWLLSNRGRGEVVEWLNQKRFTDRFRDDMRARLNAEKAKKIEAALKFSTVKYK